MTYLTHRYRRTDLIAATPGREPSTSCAAASELSPRRGFASLGSTDQGNRAPKGRQRSLVMSGILFTQSLSPLRGSLNPTNHYPRLAKPRLGLNSDRCYAAR